MASKPAEEFVAWDGGETSVNREIKEVLANVKPLQGGAGQGVQGGISHAPYREQ